MRNFWCEINIDNIEHNISKLREKTAKELMAVVKANGYGLGVSEMTRLLEEMVDAFAVSSVDEALQVQSLKDVLILYPVLHREDVEKLQDNFILTIDNTELPDILRESEKTYRVHIYVDTGMNRFGVKPESVRGFIDNIRKNYSNIIVEGIYTHLNNAADRSYSISQIETFKRVVEELDGEVPKIHMFNTAGFLKYNDEYSFDNMIRVGNVIYGYSSGEYGYRKIFSYRARPIRVYEVGKGEYIGYGNTYKTRRRTRVGILDVGFIDKFNCIIDNKKNIFFDIAKAAYHHVKYSSGIFYKGRVIKVIGKPNMNFTIINMEEIEEDALFSIDLPSVIADSSIPKKFRKGDSYVSI